MLEAVASEAPNDTILDQYLSRTRRSAELAAEALQVLPGGVVTDTRVFDPYGVYVNRALGVRKWDVDGNEYLDFFGGHGANMLGHAHPLIVEAVRDSVGRGVQYAANQPLEVALAREVTRLVPSAERVRFTGSGTEATLLAIRLARAFTGRSRIVRFAGHYHGWHDHMASGYADQFDGSAATGILAEIAHQTVLLRPGDVAGLERAAEACGGEIAAFILEPTGTHFGVVPISAEFVRKVEAVARETGALFILDEVLSGFRVDLGGVQSVYDLKPDLTTLAKVLCGGMPGGAVAGRADILNLLDSDAGRRGRREKVLHQGTFNGNPVSMAAGLAALAELERADACAHANAMGAYARDRLNQMSEAEGLPFLWYGEFSVFHLIALETRAEIQDLDLLREPMERFLIRRQPMLNRMRMALNLLGVDLNTKLSGLLSGVHQTRHIDGCVDAVAAAARMVKREGIF